MRYGGEIYVGMLLYEYKVERETISTIILIQDGSNHILYPSSRFHLPPSTCQSGRDSHILSGHASLYYFSDESQWALEWKHPIWANRNRHLLHRHCQQQEIQWKSSAESCPRLTFWNRHLPSRPSYPRILVMWMLETDDSFVHLQWENDNYALMHYWFSMVPISHC